MTTILPRACAYIPACSSSSKEQEPAPATLVPVLATATLLRGASPYVAQTQLLNVKQLRLLAAHAPGFVFVNKLRILEACSVKTVRAVITKVSLLRELHLHENCIAFVDPDVPGAVAEPADDFVDFMFQEPMRSAERFSLLDQHCCRWSPNPLSLEQLTRLLTEHPSPGIVDSIARQVHRYYEGPKTPAVIELLLQALEANPFGLRASTVVSRLVGIAGLVSHHNVHLRHECIASLLSPRLLTVFQEQYASSHDDVVFAALEMFGALADKSMLPRSLAERLCGPAIWDELLEMAPQLLASIAAMANPRRYLTQSDARAALTPIWSVIDSMFKLHRAITHARTNPVHGSVTAVQPESDAHHHRYRAGQRFMAALSAFSCSDDVAAFFRPFRDDALLDERLSGVMAAGGINTSRALLRLVAEPLYEWHLRTEQRLSAANLHLHGPPTSWRELGLTLFAGYNFSFILEPLTTLHRDVPRAQLDEFLRATSIVDIARTLLRLFEVAPAQNLFSSVDLSSLVVGGLMVGPLEKIVAAVKRVSRVCVTSAARLNSGSHRRRRQRDEDTSAETRLGDRDEVTRLFDFVNPNAVLRVLNTLTTRS